MNSDVSKFLRDGIKKGLKELPESNFDLFKRMYSHNNMDASIDEAVDNMPDEKLEHAYDQVQRTLEKRTA